MSTALTNVNIVRRGFGVHAVPYDVAWDEQRALHEQIVADQSPDTILLLEHPPVYTAGRRTPPEDRPIRRDATPRSFGALFYFCVGALAMKLISGALPPFFSSTFDLLVYAGIAISVAIAYRRFIRRTIEDRRRERLRQQERAGRS